VYARIRKRRRYTNPLGANVVWRRHVQLHIFSVSNCHVFYISWSACKIVPRGCFWVHAEYANPYVHLSMAAREQASMMYTVTLIPSKKTSMADETSYVTMIRTVASSGVRQLSHFQTFISDGAHLGLLLTS
jgi:hypothetical protein